MLQVLQGLRVLHDADIVHRDVKPYNVLATLGYDPPKTLRVALCDFGTSRSLQGLHSPAFESFQSQPGQQAEFTEEVSTLPWRAPELGDLANVGRMTRCDLKSIDVFSCGVMWPGLLTGKTVLPSQPKSFRLLHLLKWIDQPADEVELMDLGFRPGAIKFMKRVLCSAEDENTRNTIEQELCDVDWSLPCNMEVLTMRPQRLRDWLNKWYQPHHGAGEMMRDVYEPVEAMARFNYRKRPTVEHVLQMFFKVSTEKFKATVNQQLQIQQAGVTHKALDKLASALASALRSVTL
jgi:serine/threonine protein kinase